MTPVLHNKAAGSGLPESSGTPGSADNADSAAHASTGRPAVPATAPPRPGRLTALLEAVGGADDGLFDPPGPRGRRRIAVASAVSLLALAALAWAVVHQFDAHGQLQAAQWRIFGQWPVLHYLLTALWATVRVTLVSGAIALPLGALLALGRLARTPLLRWPATVYVEVLRAVPLLLLIYAFLFGLPTAGVHLPLFWQLVWPIVLTNSAVFAEIFRSGVRALPRGQTEAAHALGLSHWATMRLVVLPQAIRQTAPALVSQVVRLLKDSTLGYVVSFLELLNAAKVLGEYDHAIVQAYLVVAVVYVIVNNLLAAVAGQLERRLGGAATGPAESAGDLTA
jgi:glutamate transport system permease protein